MCVNTLINTIEDKRIKGMGYIAEKILSPRHWFQFADDTAIVTALEEDNQGLLIYSQNGLLGPTSKFGSTSVTALV